MTLPFQPTAKYDVGTFESNSFISILKRFFLLFITESKKRKEIAIVLQITKISQN